MSQEEDFERQSQQEYEEQMHLDSQLDEAANFLRRHGYLVIPHGAVNQYLGGYEVTLIPPAEIDYGKKEDPKDDGIPF